MHINSYMQHTIRGVATVTKVGWQKYFGVAKTCLGSRLPRLNFPEASFIFAANLGQKLTNNFAYENLYFVEKVHRKIKNEANVVTIS